MLIFQKFICSWLCYELVKVLYVFGLQRSDISDWSQDLHTAFNYFNNKQHEEHKVMALKVLDTFFDKTKHNSYFDKVNFGNN
jgi:hypothetical protein